MFSRWEGRRHRSRGGGYDGSVPLLVVGSWGVDGRWRWRRWPLDFSASLSRNAVYRVFGYSSATVEFDTCGAIRDLSVVLDSSVWIRRRGKAISGNGSDEISERMDQTDEENGRETIGRIHNSKPERPPQTDLTGRQRETRAVERGD